MNVEKIIQTDKEIPLVSRSFIHLMLVHNRLNEQMATALKPFEVSLEQYNVLRILRGQNGNPANLSTLNERMITKKSNTTRLVDKLILKGLVERNICPTNRRKVEIKITTTGKKSLLKMNEAVQLAEKEIFKNFSSNELQTLNTLLDKF